ncbi:MAG: twin-arginine translocation signal domain-containing protein, partial [Caldilineaceae bacterium]|nr:twin-arginine translocation signal domain-containing protein [Caldilineaceae bacterium]
MPDISQPESGGVDPEADRKIKTATDAENAVAPHDSTLDDSAQDDSTRRHNVAHDSADTTEPTDEQVARPWSRRHFLRATGAGAALIAAACGRQRGPESPLPGPNSPLGTPTPTSYDLYLPQVSNGGGVLPTAEAVALVPEPTLTPTPPKATDTPAP